MTDQQVKILCKLSNLINSIPNDLTKIIINKVEKKIKLIIKIQSLYRGKKYRYGFGNKLPRTFRLNTPISIINQKRRRDWYNKYKSNTPIRVITKKRR